MRSPPEFTAQARTAVTGVVTREFSVDANEILDWTCGVRVVEAAGANNRLPYAYLPFDGTSAEYAAINWTSPKRWDGGTIRIRFHWKEVTGTSLSVVWACSGSAVSDGDDHALAAGTGQIIVDAAQGSATKRLVSGWTSAITISGSPVGGDEILLNPYRNPAHASDTLDAVDARLLKVEIEYTITAPTDD